MRTKKILILCFMCAAALAAGVFLWLNGSFLPKWVNWNSAEEVLDLDGDGTKETLILKNKKMEILQGGEACYSSPFSWRISDAFVRELDKDQKPEIILLVWKRGSYGPNRPFWVKRDSIAFSQHVFIFRFIEGKLSPVWMSSDIGREVSKAYYDEEGFLHLKEPNGKETVWVWDNWGLMLVEEEVTEHKDKSAPNETEQSAQKSSLSLIAVGDNIAHISVVEQAYDSKKGYFDFASIYSEVADKIADYDLSFVNQETVLIRDPMRRSGYPMFATPNTMGDALVNAGFDGVLSATNHSYDAGSLGIEETVAFWRESYPEVLLLGMYGEEKDNSEVMLDEKRHYVNHFEKNGIRLALFNYTETTNGHELPANYSGGVNTLKDQENLILELQKAEETRDFSICFLHIGEEYAKEPSDQQRELAQKLTDAGADLIICSHPHILQGCEKLKTDQGAESLVYWSLGNFMSHQMNPDTVLGGAASVRIEKEPGKQAVISSYELLPLVCHFDEKLTKVYFLEEYTLKQAKEHAINQENEQFSLESLWETALRIGCRQS